MQTARPFWEDEPGTLMLLSGDVPLIAASTLSALAKHHASSKCSCTMLSTFLPNPTGYGRVLRNPAGELERIVEQRDASSQELEIREVNTGIYCFETTALAQIIDELTCKNSQKEYYLTDCVELLKKKGLRAGVVICEDAREVIGINSRAELAQMEGLLRERKLHQLMADGVTILDPLSTHVDQDVRCGKRHHSLPQRFSRKKNGHWLRLRGLSQRPDFRVHSGGQCDRTGFLPHL